jgi:DNA-binding IscR family transcriptional regulator
MANADREIEATVIAATLAARGKIGAEDIAKAVKLYRACREKIVAELKKADLAVGVDPGNR